MKVLYIPIPGSLQPWYDDFVTATGGRHDVRLFDHAGSLAEQFTDIEAVVARGSKTGTREMVDVAAQVGVRLWQITGAGLDGADIPYMLQRGLMVAHTPGQFSGIALAEHAMYFMLWFAKKYHACQDQMRSETFYGPATEELHSATLGVIGLGASGRELALRAAAFGMRVMAIDVVEVPSDQWADLGIAYLGKPSDLEHLLAESDYVSLHLPLTPQTRQLIGRRELQWMKPTAVLVNVARGELVDETALVEALRSGEIGGAGLDAFITEPLPAGHPLMEMNNVLATPHNGGGSRGTSRRRGAAAAENIDRIAQGLPLLYQIKPQA